MSPDPLGSGFFPEGNQLLDLSDPLTPEQITRATRVVQRHAIGPDDLADLLTVLGIGGAP